MRILITGGCGFVGGRLALMIKDKYPSYAITCLDNLYRKGSEINIPVLQYSGITFVRGDVRTFEDIDAIDYDLLIEASAEPSVTAGLTGDDKYLVDTNFNGLFNCVRSAVKKQAKIIFLSTSRIFPMSVINSLDYDQSSTRYSLLDSGIKGATEKGLSEELCKEGTRSLYGFSKYAGELLISEYQEMFGLKAVINRCGLIAGEGQFGKTDQGVITHWAASYIYDKPLSIFGSGRQVRDVLNVKDLFRLIDMQMHDFNKFSGEIFNVGGGMKSSLSISELDLLCKKMIKAKDVPVLPERALDIKYYVTDNTKIAGYGWTPQITAMETLAEIIRWLNENKEDLRWIFA